MVIFLNFSLTSNHLHPLQVENCDSNSRLVVDEDDNGIFRLERVKVLITFYHSLTLIGLVKSLFSFPMSRIRHCCSLTLWTARGASKACKLCDDMLAFTVSCFNLITGSL